MARARLAILVFALFMVLSASGISRQSSQDSSILDEVFDRASTSHNDCNHKRRNKPQGRPLAPSDISRDLNKRILVSLPFKKPVHHIESLTAHKANGPGPLELELMKKYSQWVIKKSDSTETLADMKEVEELFTQAARDDIPKSFREFSAETEKYAKGSSSWRYKALKAFIQGIPKQIVNKEEVSKEPYNAIGVIKQERQKEYGICTGTFIGPRHILTSAHCLYDAFKKKWERVISFHLQHVCNEHGETSDEGIKFEWDMSIVPKGHVDLNSREYDYGLLIVKDNGVKPPTMNFGWDGKTDLELMKTRWPVQMAGYPHKREDKGLCMWKLNDCTLTLPAPKEKSSLHHLEVRHCSPGGGASGSSFYSADSSGIPTSYCIQSSYVKYKPDEIAWTPENSYCVRITKLLFATLVQWMKQY